jgi:uncharacterized protein YdbL (DUF1318 family)
VRSTANRTKLTPEKRERFLTILRTDPNVSAAARAINISRRHAYTIREQDPAFAQAWDEAVDEAVDTLETEARRRAIEGTTRPVFYKGEEVGGIREYSDTLTIFLLKAHRPEKYRERTSTELTGPDGGPVEFRVTRRIITTPTTDDAT